MYVFLGLPGVIIIYLAAGYAIRTWYRLNAERNKSRRILAQITKIYEEAIALPASLPKTFPTETQFVPLRELPPELQRRVVGHFRTLGREENEDVL